jgi:hypothetical protein
MLFGANMHQAQAQVTPEAQSKQLADFRLVTSAGAASCLGLRRAGGRVRIESFQENQHMRVELVGLPAHLGFDVFVIQVPNAPFGLSWYQGDISTDSRGNGAADFIGIFDSETFSVAPGMAPAPAPTPHTKPPFPDANKNPLTGPVHQYHIGVWFDSPDTAKKAGCPAATATLVTPFNGDHTAGIQAFNTSEFLPLDGPLGRIK